MCGGNLHIASDGVEYGHYGKCPNFHRYTFPLKGRNHTISMDTEEKKDGEVGLDHDSEANVEKDEDEE